MKRIKKTKTKLTRIKKTKPEPEIKKSSGNKITHHFGGFLPYPPDYCKAPRIVNSTDNILWVDRAFCITTCEGRQCERYFEENNERAEKTRERIRRDIIRSERKNKND